MPMQWNAEANARLLVGILHTTRPKIDYKALADFMGPECTINAIRFQISALKKGAELANPSNKNGEESVTNTPTKRVRATPKKGGSVRKKSAKKEVSDDEDGMGTPSKKAKKEEEKEEDGDEEEKVKMEEIDAA